MFSFLPSSGPPTLLLPSRWWGWQFQPASFNDNSHNRERGIQTNLLKIRHLISYTILSTIGIKKRAIFAPIFIHGASTGASTGADPLSPSTLPPPPPTADLLFHRIIKNVFKTWAANCSQVVLVHPDYPANSTGSGQICQKLNTSPLTIFSHKLSASGKSICVNPLPLPPATTLEAFHSLKLGDEPTVCHGFWSTQRQKGWGPITGVFLLGYTHWYGA